jgi:shikimate dehydrogenase
MTADLQRNVPGKVRFESWTGMFQVPQGVDILVNATSIGLYPGVENMPDVDISGASPAMLVCDVVFNPPETPFLRAAKKRGMPVLDGLSMLVYQGVIGFELWTGRPAPESVMKAALRKALLA